MLKKLVAEMHDKSDETSNMSETSRTSLNCIEKKHKNKGLSEENRGRDNKKKRSVEMKGRRNDDTNEVNDENNNDAMYERAK